MTPPADSPLVVHVVSHTHWDREWYLPASRFRQRLVALIDALLDDREDDAPFLLDGQTIVLEDYLEVRPERRELLAASLRDGSIEAGPWYVLADELITSGESLVRNLFAGRATLRALGATAPNVLYSPDAFGHPAMLPAIAAGFGMPVIVLWRGYGGQHHPHGDVARWRAPDGSSALLYHLSPDGYELGASLSVDEREARERWESLRSVLAPRATVGVVLLPNGADHHERQPNRRRAVASLAAVGAPDQIGLSSLEGFGRALVTAAETTRVPEVTGELRDSYGYTWTLQGTLASRSALKRRAAFAERDLLRDTEPWVALAKFIRGVDRRALMRSAWKPLLQCHPHDTICGCSIDAVALAMASRLSEAETQADGLRDDAIFDIVGHDVVAARAAPERWKPSVVVRNPSAHARGGIAHVEVLAAPRHVRVGPGSSTDIAGETTEAMSVMLGSGEIPMQLLGAGERHDRIESPQSYPWDDIVHSVRVAIWVPEIGGYGTRWIPLRKDDPLAKTMPFVEVRSGEHWMENAELRVDVDAHGTVRLATRDGTRVISSLIELEGFADLGDLYTPSPRGDPFPVKFAEAAIGQDGPLFATIVMMWSVGGDDIPLVIVLGLDAGSSFLRVNIRGDNAREDCRLRLRLNTDVSRPQIFADATFGPVRRDPIVAPSDSKESAPRTAPLARYVTLASRNRGATIYSDGLGEYEALDDGVVAITLFRAVGELSRNDIPERPGHAGWPVSTPNAQQLGMFDARFAVMLHGPRDDATIDTIERTADDVLHPLSGNTIRSTLRLPEPTDGVSLDGRGLSLSAIKTSEDGEWLVLRCVNLTDRAVVGDWVLGADVSEARTSRLDELPGAPIPLSGRRVPILAGPRAIVTILVR
ncbi:MAG: glycoside hydrolase family 38 C-terminal domain-containing protein [Gemmatimonadales bacterium]